MILTNRKSARINKPVTWRKQKEPARAEGGVPCPNCSRRNNQVIDSRPNKDGIRRRRACVCGWRFTTYEVTALEMGLDYQI